MSSPESMASSPGESAVRVVGAPQYGLAQHVIQRLLKEGTRWGAYGDLLEAQLRKLTTKERATLILKALRAAETPGSRISRVYFPMYVPLDGGDEHNLFPYGAGVYVSGSSAVTRDFFDTRGNNGIRVYMLRVCNTAAAE